MIVVEVMACDVSLNLILKTIQEAARVTIMHCLDVRNGRMISCLVSVVFHHLRAAVRQLHIVATLRAAALASLAVPKVRSFLALPKRVKTIIFC